MLSMVSQYGKREGAKGKYREENEWGARKKRKDRLPRGPRRGTLPRKEVEAGGYCVRAYLKRAPDIEDREGKREGVGELPEREQMKLFQASGWVLGDGRSGSVARPGSDMDTKGQKTLSLVILLLRPLAADIPRYGPRPMKVEGKKKNKLTLNLV